MKVQDTIEARQVVPVSLHINIHAERRFKWVLVRVAFHIIDASLVQFRSEVDR